MMLQVSDEDIQPIELFRPVVIAPTYNHSRTLLALIGKIHELSLPMLVINDGSTDRTRDVLDEAVARHWLKVGNILHHAINGGKAAALHTGFAHAASHCYTHALTIDTDGQHDPADIPSLLSLARSHRHALILGQRSDQLPGYPRASLIGRILANLTIRLSTGVTLEDSQCGLRVYPLPLVSRVRCHRGRYAYESEILTRALWAGWKIIGTPISSSYAPKAQRISHFRNIRDSLEGVGLQLYLLLRSFMPWPHQRTAPKEEDQS